jgi:hypothetical protein
MNFSAFLTLNTEGKIGFEFARENENNIKSLDNAWLSCSICLNDFALRIPVREFIPWTSNGENT